MNAREKSPRRFVQPSFSRLLSRSKSLTRDPYSRVIGPRGGIAWNRVEKWATFYIGERGRGGKGDLASAIISRCKWSGRISSGRLISVAGNARSICRSLSIDRPTPGPAHCHAEWLQLHAISIIMTKSRSCARCSYGARERGEGEDDRRFRLRKAASSLPGVATIIDQRSTRVRVARLEQRSHRRKHRARTRLSSV